VTLIVAPSDIALPEVD